MRNDVHPPPPDPDEAPRPHKVIHDPVAHPVREAVSSPHNHHLEPHQDLREPGKHHSRIVGDATRTEPMYAMPMEERGSSFNVWMTVLALAVAIAIIFAFYMAFK